ncbi:MAG: signal peptidase I [Candidatus Chisholmbacteria bacterium RIFCSPLOWO2_01_FULL_49_14]|uniref:Signal peptidase I n=1 Tax=Candidatus Chisholmbacteria bacterium RIFCSPLOWO2_01_FULL_49_14 TaxID=1797593 RepID=A0A1G1VZI8_9BACT|nr:MAG: signal peptidase I [Candidatus Chisholmbacteria bacterium RIFCSPLOWO2_01_FULL_49_14]
MKLLRVIARFFLDIIETVVVALAIFILIYLFVVQPHQVNGNSMWPSFLDGEYLLTDKFSYRFREPMRGDVIIFLAPSGARCPQQLQCDFVKRIIALPHETVSLKEGGVYVNNTLLHETYLPSDPAFETDSPTGNPTSVELKDDQYFVMGDNRGHSSDSRAWGSVPRDNIVGKAWLRYWPPQRVGFIAVAAY